MSNQMCLPLPPPFRRAKISLSRVRTAFESGVSPGHEHHNRAFSSWLTGGGANYGIVRDRKAKQRYCYRSRVIVAPFTGEEQIWDEYQRWTKETKAPLPDPTDGAVKTADL